MNPQATGLRPVSEAGAEKPAGPIEPAVSAVKPKAPWLRPARFEDYLGISSLESQYGLRSKSREDWEHLWRGNPLWKTLSNWPIGWVLQDDSEQIVGHIGNVPLAYEFDGQAIFAATSRSFVVDTRFRSFSFSLLRNFFGQSGVDLFLNTSVNEKAARLQTSFGAVPVPSGHWNRAVFWITGYQGFAASVLARRGGGQSFGGPLAGAALFLQDKWSDLHPRQGEEKVGLCGSFDERFDRFWEVFRSSSSAQLQAIRSAQYLQWHFGPSLRRGETSILTQEDSTGLTAYAILSRDDNEELGLHRTRLVDLQFLPGKESSIEVLVAAALAGCQKDGIHMLEAVGFSAAVGERLSRLSRHSRKLSSWRYFYRANREPLAAALTDARAWNPTCYDGDSSL